MKNLLALALVGTIAVSVFVPLTTYALGASSGVQAPSTVTDSTGNTAEAPAAGTSAASGSTSAGGSAQREYKHCSPVTVLECLRDAGAWSMIFAVHLIMIGLGIAGMIFDIALWFTFNLGTQLNASKPLGQAISAGWTIFRDLGNLLLIAGLIWASIAMILQIESGGQKPGALIAKLIVAALLVNFSYFFTAALIDGSNILSKTIYDSTIQSVVSIDVAGGNITAPFGTKQSAEVQKFLASLSVPFFNTPFTGIFLEQTKIAAVLDPKYLTGKENFTFHFFAIMTFATLIFGTTMYNFATMAFSVIARLVILIILLITSPIFVLQFTGLKPLSEWGKHWWDSLVSQLVFLPVFILLSMISFSIIGKFMSMVELGGKGYFLGAWAGLMEKDPEQMVAGIATLLFFAMGWGLLRASRDIAHSISIQAPTALPKVEMLQNPAFGLGKGVAGGLGFVANAPRNLANMARKPLFRMVGNVATGTGQKLEDISGGMWKMTGIPWARKTAEDFTKRLTPAGQRERRSDRFAEEQAEGMAGRLPQLVEDLKSGDPKKVKEATEFLHNFFTNPQNKKVAARVYKGLSDEQQAAVDHAIGDEEKIKELVDAGRGQTAIVGGSHSSNEPPLGPKLDDIAKKLQTGNNAALTAFKRLTAAEQLEILLARKEILKDGANTKKVVDAVGAAEFAEHLTNLPPSRYTEQPHIAAHMTSESYAALRAKYGSHSKEIDAIHTAMRASGTGGLIEAYDKTPNGRPYTEE